MCCRRYDHPTERPWQPCHPVAHQLLSKVDEVGCSRQRQARARRAVSAAQVVSPILFQYSLSRRRFATTVFDKQCVHTIPLNMRVMSDNVILMLLLYWFCGFEKVYLFRDKTSLCL